jgi:hypothetical protein
MLGECWGAFAQEAAEGSPSRAARLPHPDVELDGAGPRRVVDASSDLEPAVDRPLGNVCKPFRQAVERGLS